MPRVIELRARLAEIDIALTPFEEPNTETLATPEPTTEAAQGDNGGPANDDPPGAGGADPPTPPQIRWPRRSLDHGPDIGL
jgi:hypothetical protein